MFHVRYSENKQRKKNQGIYTKSLYGKLRLASRTTLLLCFAVVRLIEFPRANFQNGKNESSDCICIYTSRRETGSSGRAMLQRVIKYISVSFGVIIVISLMTSDISVNFVRVRLRSESFFFFRFRIFVFFFVEGPDDVCARCFRCMILKAICADWCGRIWSFINVYFASVALAKVFVCTARAEIELNAYIVGCGLICLLWYYGYIRIYCNDIMNAIKDLSSVGVKLQF